MMSSERTVSHPEADPQTRLETKFERFLRDREIAERKERLTRIGRVTTGAIALTIGLLNSVANVVNALRL